MAQRATAETAVVALVHCRAAGVLAGALASGAVVFWDAATLARRGAVTPHAGAVALLAAGAAGTLVLSAGARDPGVAVLSAARRTLVRTLRGHAAPVSHAALYARDTRAATAARDGTVRVWDTATGTALHVCQCCTTSICSSADDSGGGALHAPITALAVHEGTGDGEVLLAAGTGAGVVAVWDARGGTERLCVHAHTGAVAGAVLADARRVLSCADDGTALMLDVRRGAPLCSFLPCSGGVRAIAAAPAAPRAHTLRVATAMPDGRLVWQDVAEDPATGFITAADAHALPAHAGAVATLFAVAPPESSSGSSSDRDADGDGRAPALLVTVGADDHCVRLWDAGVGSAGVRCVAVLRGHRDAVVAAAVLSRTRVATAARDGTLALWDVAGLLGAAAPGAAAGSAQAQSHAHATPGSGGRRRQRHSALFFDHRDGTP